MSRKSHDAQFIVLAAILALTLKIVLIVLDLVKSLFEWISVHFIYISSFTLFLLCGYYLANLVDEAAEKRLKIKRENALREAELYESNLREAKLRAEQFEKNRFDASSLISPAVDETLPNLSGLSDETIPKLSDLSSKQKNKGELINRYLAYQASLRLYQESSSLREDECSNQQGVKLKEEKILDAIAEANKKLEISNLRYAALRQEKEHSKAIEQKLVALEEVKINQNPSELDKKQHHGFDLICNNTGDTGTGTGTLNSKSANKTNLELDMVKVAELEKESNLISAILSQIFDDNSVEAAQPKDLKALRSETSEKQNICLLGLDEAHSGFLKAICKKEFWEPIELAELAKTFNLMSLGAIEKINDATFEAFNAAIIEGNDYFTVDLPLASEIIK